MCTLFFFCKNPLTNKQKNVAKPLLKDSSDIKHIRELVNLLNENINNKSNDSLYIRGKMLLFSIDDLSSLNNLEASIKNLNIHRAKGFRLAIDDFETFYSHIELLSKLTVDYIKIDGMFIQGVEKDAQKLKTLNALVYVSKTITPR